MILMCIKGKLKAIAEIEGFEKYNATFWKKPAWVVVSW